ncbi:MAG TPA: ABC transporter permease [Nitrososphaerales archaeon]|nr:ABC transporter permease [Nitrososphaerales archaeon]
MPSEEPQIPTPDARSRAQAAGAPMGSGQSTMHVEEADKLNKSVMHGLWALTWREIRKAYQTPILVFMTVIQPVIWLGLFGKAFNLGSVFSSGSFNIPGLNIPKQVLDQLSSQMLQSTFGTSDYFSFLAVGMLTFVLVFTCMFSGMSIVWDRRFGFLEKVLGTPVSRGAIVMGKVLSSVVKSFIQAAIVLVIAVLLGMSVADFSIAGILGTFAALFLLALGLSSLFVMLALRSTDWQQQMAIMNLLNLPLLFASNALFPTKLMPTWLQDVAKVNPISYGVDVGRQLLLGSPGFSSLAFDFAYLLGFAVLFSAVGIVLSWKLLSK